MEMKKEEIAFRREQLSMEEKRIEAEQKRQAQMQEQFLIQQRHAVAAADASSGPVPDSPYDFAGQDEQI